MQSIGIPLGFLDHASRDQLVDALRLRPQDVARDVLAALPTPPPEPSPDRRRTREFTLVGEAREV